MKWCAAVIVILIWGITFVNTRALLGDFSALEILVVRFAIAWVALCGWEAWRGCCNRNVAIIAGGGIDKSRKTFEDEWLFVIMGFCGIFCYQFLENCAIYYTNASNVSIFVSFGPIVTAALARILIRDRSFSASLVAGSMIAVVGVALVSYEWRSQSAFATSWRFHGHVCDGFLGLLFDLDW